MLLLSLFISSLFALPFHGDIHLRIIQISKEIEQNPDSTALYLKRGELYFQHEVYDSSYLDFQTCEALGDFPSTRFYFSYAKTLSKLEKNEEALYYLHLILKDDPVNVNTIRLAAKIFANQNDFCKSGEYYLRVINGARKTMPYNYIEAAEAALKCNNEIRSEPAINILLRGIDDLGPLVTLYNKIIHIYVDDNQYDKAIEYQSIVVDKSSRKEFPLYRRAKLYLENQNYEKAKADIIAARTEIKKLPLRMQSLTSVKDLELNLDAFLLIRQN